MFSQTVELEKGEGVKRKYFDDGSTLPTLHSQENLGLTPPDLDVSKKGRLARPVSPSQDQGGLKTKVSQPRFEVGTSNHVTEERLKESKEYSKRLTKKLKIEQEEEAEEALPDSLKTFQSHKREQIALHFIVISHECSNAVTHRHSVLLKKQIINFYMKLLMERGKRDGMPKVYSFETFFYPKVMSGGHLTVKRWTRKVDVLAVDYILVPVHLGVHWCLAVINFKLKEIQYYDSMGGSNTECLNALKKYLQDESLDKKKEEFDIKGWKCSIVKDIPQQKNGSDCGMFACKFADYITREKSISFTQEHMPYFRRRMVYEIVEAKLLE